jgi:predicted nucleotidyltransferase
MERETVKEVLRQFNDSGVRYCLVGGLALAHHSIPRLTQDVDVLILPEDLHLVEGLLRGHRVGATAVVTIFQVGDTRIDIIPANLRAERQVVLGAIEDAIDELPVKVASLRDLILLKMWAAPERPQLGKRMRDEADVAELIEINANGVTAEDIAYVCRTLLSMAYTSDDVKKYRTQVDWLNGILEKLGLSDRRYVVT